MTPPTLLNFKAWGQRMEHILGEQVLEGHLLGSLLAIDIMKSMLTAGFWIFAPDTMISKVASLSSHPTLLAYLWMALSILVLPYFFMQAFGFLAQYRRRITRLACRTILFGGVLWAYLAYLSRNIDSANITPILVMHSFISVAMSAILAVSINAAQDRESTQPPPESTL